MLIGRIRLTISLFRSVSITKQAVKTLGAISRNLSSAASTKTARKTATSKRSTAKSSSSVKPTRSKKTEQSDSILEPKAPKPPTAKSATRKRKVSTVTSSVEASQSNQSHRIPESKATESSATEPKTRKRKAAAASSTTKASKSKQSDSIPDLKPRSTAAKSAPTKSATTKVITRKRKATTTKPRKKRTTVTRKSSSQSKAEPVKTRKTTKKSNAAIKTSSDMSSSLSQQPSSSSVSKPPKHKAPSKSRSKASSAQDASLSRSASLPVGDPLPESPSASPSTSSSVPAVAPPTTFFCYLLRSDSVKKNGATYIGFTTNPVRRLRQHNGDITAGARKTSYKRPWSMIACVHGFPTKIAALQFEWQWTYPKKSRRLRTLMNSGRRWTSGTKGKLELLYALVSSSPWSHLPLHIRFTSQTYYDDYHNVIMKRSDRELVAFERAMSLKSDEAKAEKMLAHHIYQLPSHIDVTAGPLVQLPMYLWLESQRKRGKKSSAQTDSPAASDDDLSVDTMFDDGPNSGEESHDSDEDGDAFEPGSSDAHDHVIDVIEDDLSSSDNVQSNKQCTICRNDGSINSRSRMFLTECPSCSTSMHLVCAASHILNNLPQKASSIVPALPIASSLPTSPFASMPSSLPLVPPLATGQCPSCRASWNWPYLVDRCRTMFVDAKGRRGGDTFYNAASSSSAMTQLMKEFAGRQHHDDQTGSGKKKAAPKSRKRKAAEPSDSSLQTTITESFAEQEISFTQPASSSTSRRIEMHDRADQSSVLSPQSLKRSLLASAATKRLAGRSQRAETTEIIDVDDRPVPMPARRSLSNDDIIRRNVVDLDASLDDQSDYSMLSLRERLARRKKQ